VNCEHRTLLPGPACVRVATRTKVLPKSGTTSSLVVSHLAARAAVTICATNPPPPHVDPRTGLSSARATAAWGPERGRTPNRPHPYLRQLILGHASAREMRLRVLNSAFEGLSYLIFVCGERGWSIPTPCTER
jgi:hypothetical protein